MDETKPWSPTLRLGKATILQADGVDCPGSPLPVVKFGMMRQSTDQVPFFSTSLQNEASASGQDCSAQGTKLRQERGRGEAGLMA